MNSNDTTKTTIADETDSDFSSISGHDTGLPSFVIAMLRIAQIITAKEFERREITAVQINRWMTKHRNVLPRVYKPKEIRDRVNEYGGEIRGGGVKIEWYELPEKHYGSPTHYHFTFSRLMRQADIDKEVSREPV